MFAEPVPPDNVVAVLYLQHARIRDQFDVVTGSAGPGREAAFDLLRELLAAHEAAESVALRAFTEKLLPPELTRARSVEEEAAARELAELERLDAQSPEFAARLRLLEEAFALHAVHEETEEFPAVLAELSEREQRDLGRWVLRASAGGPTGRPSPGRYTALRDRARERLAEVRRTTEPG
ncbi:MAG TPA: hemerythrin domain-containing protein [Actinospica sp.]|jgi:hypothetical protein|nr:hemerythrin domain-containing protein [Actinospica sp.]